MRTDSTHALELYEKIGLKYTHTYFRTAEDIEFAQMESEIDIKGQKIASEYEIRLVTRQANVDQRYLDWLKWNRNNG